MSPFEAALCNSSVMKLEGEVESERRRKGSILLFACTFGVHYSSSSTIMKSAYNLHQTSDCSLQSSGKHSSNYHIRADRNVYYQQQ